jgi:GNAT superfamily N-acetyltransferase
MGRDGTSDAGDRRGARAAIAATLAAQCACNEADFAASGVVVTEASERAGRLRFPVPTKPLLVATLGAGVVISCHPSRVAWARNHLAGLDRDALFGAALIARLARYVGRDGQELVGPILRYACSRDSLRIAPVPDGVAVTLVNRSELPALYRYTGFAHALSYRRDHPRPDMVAAVARRGAAVVGIAAASADSDLLWQIGVEVVAAERGRGIGRAIVGRLTEAVLDRGRVPYYSTTVANLRSRALALGSGYWPAWTDLYARDR